jgi:hypothetical protein
VIHVLRHMAANSLMQSANQAARALVGRHAHSLGLSVARPGGAFGRSTGDVAGKVERFATAILGPLEVGRTMMPLTLRSHLDRHPHNPAASNMSTPAICHVAQRVWRHVRIEPSIATTWANALLTVVAGPMRFPAAQALLLPGEMSASWACAPKALTPGGGIHPELSIGQVAG